MESGAGSGDNSPFPLCGDNTPREPPTPQQQPSSCVSSPVEGENVHYKIELSNILGGEVDPEFLEMEVSNNNIVSSIYIHCCWSQKHKIMNLLPVYVQIWSESIVKKSINRRNKNNL